MRSIFKPVNKQITALVEGRVKTYPAPYYYKILGVSGMGTDKESSAKSTFCKLKEWTESLGGEASIIENRFHWHKRRWNPGCCLVVEITDPAAKKIDEILAAQN